MKEHTVNQVPILKQHNRLKLLTFFTLFFADQLFFLFPFFNFLINFCLLFLILKYVYILNICRRKTKTFNKVSFFFQVKHSFIKIYCLNIRREIYQSNYRNLPYTIF